MLAIMTPNTVKKVPIDSVAWGPRWALMITLGIAIPVMHHSWNDPIQLMSAEVWFVRMVS